MHTCEQIFADFLFYFVLNVHATQQCAKHAHTFCICVSLQESADLSEEQLLSLLDDCELTELEPEPRDELH